jgi:hypothetical protein
MKKELPTQYKSQLYSDDSTSKLEFVFVLNPNAGSSTVFTEAARTLG